MYAKSPFRRAPQGACELKFVLMNYLNDLFAVAPRKGRVS